MLIGAQQEGGGWAGLGQGEVGWGVGAWGGWGTTVGTLSVNGIVTLQPPLRPLAELGVREA